MSSPAPGTPNTRQVECRSCPPGSSTEGAGVRQRVGPGAVQRTPARPHVPSGHPALLEPQSRRRQPEQARQGDRQQLSLPPSPCALWGGSGPPPPAPQLPPSPFVLQDGGQVAGLVPRGSAGVDDVGAGSRGQEEGGEAAGLQEGRAPLQERAATTPAPPHEGSHSNTGPSPPSTGSLCLAPSRTILPLLRLRSEQFTSHPQATEAKPWEPAAEFPTLGPQVLQQSQPQPSPRTLHPCPWFSCPTARCSPSAHLVLQNYVSRRVQQVVVEVRLRREHQQLREMKIQQEFLPGESPQFLHAARKAQGG